MLIDETPEPLQPAEAHAARLLAWYDRHRRVLPWRALPGERPDPYAVWLSEIMLQQTTVAAVKAYYAKFLALWPTVEALAAAPVEDVMREWAGLGYYSRARNLHACAKAVMLDGGGRFPDAPERLLTLPGIGVYTAAAIAAIAFGKRATVVDGNVERVVARLHALTIELPRARPAIRRLAEALTPIARAGDYAQAMMDLGATICTPRRPLCSLCPLNEGCLAVRDGDPSRFPLKTAKAGRPVRDGAAFVAMRGDGAVLVRRRPPKGLLGGMLELPTSDWSSAAAAAAYREAATTGASPFDGAPFDAAWRSMGRADHVFTHFALKLDVFVADIGSQRGPPDWALWVEASHADEALPTVFRKVLALATGRLSKRVAGEAQPALPDI